MVTLKKCLAGALLASLFLGACRSGQELALAKAHLKDNTVKSQNPQFLDNVTVGGNGGRNNVKTKIPATIHGNSETLATARASRTCPIPDKKTLLNLQKESILTEDNFLCNKYAMLLGIMPTAITNYSLYNFVEEWYGTRYRMGGIDKSGIDCSAFVQRLYESVFGTEVVRTAREQFDACQHVADHSQLKEGDLVFFRIKSRRISHVGVYLANDYFVHASASRGVMISNLNEGYWTRYFAGAGKML